MSLDSPEVELKNLVRDEWNPVAVLGIDNAVNGGPIRIHHGWLDAKYDKPEVTVGNPDENPVGGGVTGYSGIKPDGSGPTQDVAGVTPINVWASQDRVAGLTDPGGDDINARQLVFLMKELVRVTLHEHFEGTRQDGTQTDFYRFAFGGAERRTNFEEGGAGETMWRWEIAAEYSYHAEPPTP